MKKIIHQLLKHKDKTIPVLSLPAAQRLGIPVKQMLASSDGIADGMVTIATECPVGACMCVMDLSVEAEAFGAKIKIHENEIPEVEKGIIADIAMAGDICVPQIGAGRTQVYLDSVTKAKERLKDIPVLCGVIGPYSLAGRLFDMTELMLACYDEPEQVKILLSKATAFIKDYIHAFKQAGADGVFLAEPAAGLLSPALAEAFSMPYVQEIFDSVNDDDFVVCYHNCGNTVADMLDAIAQLNADIFHFGNAINLQKALERMPGDKIIMGNVDPVLLRTGSVQDVRSEVFKIYQACAQYENFMISTGCDVPAASKWENIDAFFDAIKESYAQNQME